LVGAAFLLRNRRPQPRYWLLCLPALLGACQWASGQSADTIQTLSRSIHWLALGTIFFVAFHELRSARRRRNVLAITCAAAIALVAFSVTQFCTSSGKVFWMWPAGEPNVFGPFQNRNNFASFILLFLPVIVWQAQHRPNQRLRWLTGGAFLL